MMLDRFTKRQKTLLGSDGHRQSSVLKEQRQVTIGRYIFVLILYSLLLSAVVLFYQIQSFKVFTDFNVVFIIFRICLVNYRDCAYGRFL